MPSRRNIAILKNKKGGKCANTHRPVWGTSPGFVQSKFFAPVREPPPTGATALEVQQANHHSRKNARQEADENIPEEAFHGDTLLSGEAAPHPYPTKSYTYPQSISPVSGDTAGYLFFILTAQHPKFFFKPLG